MSTPLVLPAGVTIADPYERLIRFLENEWEIYDGQPNAQDSTLSLFDILVSVSMNSRLDTADKVRSVWDGRHAVEEALRVVPADIPLECGNVPWGSLETLFEAFCAIPHAKEAVATKILHRKRPSLIPIVDSVIGAYLNKVRGSQLPRGMCIGKRIVEQVTTFREVLLAHLSEMTELCGLVAEKGYPIARVRALEILMWVEIEPNAYYRK